MMKKRIFKNQLGDTIVEVMIALAILTLTLGGAYYSASLSLRNDSSSQEHSEATELAQSQIEALWARAQTESPFLSSDSTGTCLDTSSLQPQAANYCNFDNSGSPNCAASNGGFCYTITDQLTNPSDSTCLGDTSNITCYNYAITVSWPALGGGTNNQIVLDYRLDENG